MLYPRESETREVKDLSGIWQFKPDTKGLGERKDWYKKPLTETIDMPVPASYNDVTQDPAIRDHVGDVWYETIFFAPLAWQDRSVFLRFGSATHHAAVWINGKKVTEHKGGYLPFGGDVSKILRYGAQNRVTAKISNILDWTTIPPGVVRRPTGPKYPPGFVQQEYYHDFFNYAGLHRPVRLVATPKIRIDDITVTTQLTKGGAKINYNLKTIGKAKVDVSLLDKSSKCIAKAKGIKASLHVSKPKLWEPGHPYLYTFEAKLLDSNDGLVDSYRLPIGIRTIQVKNRQFLINGKPFYFKGFGKHEDSDIRGKGLDHALNVKDFNLLKWIGANSFRTSHYPYSEEIMNMADEQGMVVIDETTAVGFNFSGKEQPLFCAERVGSKALEHHHQVLQELVERDKNHPSVVMWSIANEAATHEKGAIPYFKRLAREARKLDGSRPITIVQSSSPYNDRVAQFFDVVCVNRYRSWYTDAGRLDVVETQVERELRDWHKKYKQSVIMSEYGADTIAGFHSDPPVMFSEEYQCEMLHRYHKVFDRLNFVIGEHIWNFADFATKQGITRVMGNKKGVFTRQRQPKAIAHMMRKRWSSIPNFFGK